MSLFQRQDYLLKNTCKPIEEFDFDGVQLKFSVVENIAYLPYHSTYASFEGDLKTSHVTEFLQRLKGRVDKIVFKLPPNYTKRAVSQLSILLERGFVIAHIDLCQYLMLDESFSLGIHSKKRKIIALLVCLR